MPTVAYITNQFPSQVEPYVVEEIRELRRRGVEIIPCSARRADVASAAGLKPLVAETLYLIPAEIKLSIRATPGCACEGLRH